MSAKQWHQAIEEWKGSGLTIAKYCQQHKLSTSSFYQWKSKLSGRCSSLTKITEDDDWIAIAPEPQKEKAWDIELSLPGNVVLRMRQP